MRSLAAMTLAVPLLVQAHELGPRAAAALAAQPYLGVIREAPDFTLLDIDGRPVRLARLRGQPVLVAFIYTSCTSACPVLSFRMAELQAKLARARLEAQLVSVTVDPERDDAATLRRFGAAFGAGPGWHFLREAPERLAPVLADYEEWTRRDGAGLDHPARVHLIDAAGRVREIYSLEFFDETQAFLDIRALVREQKAKRGDAARGRGRDP